MEGEPNAGPESAATIPGRRHFNLGDGMILVAALAAWLALSRRSIGYVPEKARRWWLYAILWWTDDRTPRYETVFFNMGHGRKFTPTPKVLRHTFLRWSYDLSASIAVPAFLALVIVTPALLIIRLRKPRPPIDAVFRRPGSAALLASSTTFWGGLGFCIYVYWYFSANALLIVVGLATASAIGLAELGRSRHADRDWVDRLGYSAGCLWVVVGLVALFLGPIHL